LQELRVRVPLRVQVLLQERELLQVQVLLRERVLLQVLLLRLPLQRLLYR
jgi:hypothetical protein